MSINFRHWKWGEALFILVIGISAIYSILTVKGVAAEINDNSIKNASETTKEINNIVKIIPCQQESSRVDLLRIDYCAKEEALETPKSIVKRVKVVLTGYSSTFAQTDDTPFITANGTYVHDGIVANNGLPFGTQIKIPDIYGDKVFCVEDRMHWSKGEYHFDIWFPTYEQAKNFGVKYACVEILENN